MTLGLFLPLLLALVALTEIPLFLSWRAKGIVSERAFPVLAIASVAFHLSLMRCSTMLCPNWAR